VLQGERTPRKTARRIAAPYGLWVRSVRTGAGAIPFPTIEDALRYEWSDADRELVADRVDTQFVGSPQTVAESSASCNGRPGPTSCWSPRSRPTTPTESTPSNS
jgi:hypothetical protein